MCEAESELLSKLYVSAGEGQWAGPFPDFNAFMKAWSSHKLGPETLSWLYMSEQPWQPLSEVAPLLCCKAQAIDNVEAREERPAAAVDAAAPATTKALEKKSPDPLVQTVVALTLPRLQLAAGSRVLLPAEAMDGVAMKDVTDWGSVLPGTACDLKYVETSGETNLAQFAVIFDSGGYAVCDAECPVLCGKWHRSEEQSGAIADGKDVPPEARAAQILRQASGARLLEGVFLGTGEMSGKMRVFRALMKVHCGGKNRLECSLVPGLPVLCEDIFKGQKTTVLICFLEGRVSDDQVTTEALPCIYR